MHDPIDKVMKNVAMVPESGCWIWLGGLSPKGYPIGRPEKKSVRIHRWLYQKIFGSVGDLTMDHLCKVRCCINPYHMEPVTGAENSLRGDGPTAINSRKTHCLRGHEFDRSTFRITGALIRRCSICMSMQKAGLLGKSKG